MDKVLAFSKKLLKEVIDKNSIVVDATARKPERKKFKHLTSNNWQLKIQQTSLKKQN